MIQREDQTSYEIQALAAIRRRVVSKISPDPRNPAGTVLYDRSIDSRANRPHPAHLIIPKLKFVLLRGERETVHRFCDDVFLDLNEVGIRPGHSQQGEGIASANQG